MLPPLEGKEIGGCKIIKKLGEGGMGVAYQAHHTRLDRAVVLKILLPDWAKDPEQAKAFLLEAQAAARLEHPRIVQVYDQGSQGGLHYITMQFVDGETLEDLMARQKQIPSLKAISIIKAALEGLGEAHRHGIVHRDVKPSNILLGKDGSIRLSDFGLALKMTKGKAQDTKIIGTPLYMSPEQIWGIEMDGRSDIYSMGATLYHMLAGKPPFDGATATDIVSAHVNNPAPDIRQAASGISKAMAELLLNMMAKQPEDRPSSVEAVLAALNSPAMVMADAAVEGESMIDLGIKVGPGRRRTLPPQFAAADTSPGGGDVYPDGPPVTAAPRKAEPAPGTAWRAPLGGLLWLAAGAAAYWGGLSGNTALAGGAVLSAAGALFLAPRAFGAGAVFAAAGCALLYFSGSGGATAAVLREAKDWGAISFPLGLVLICAAWVFSETLYRGALDKLAYLCVSAGGAFALLSFGLPQGNDAKMLFDPAVAHPYALPLLAGAAASALLVMAVCATRPHSFLAAVLVGANAFCAYAAGALHHQTMRPPEDPGLVERARVTAEEREKRSQDVMVVVEDGETVVRRRADVEPDAEDAITQRERPDYAAALSVPLEGLWPRLKSNAGLLLPGLLLVLAGSVLFWHKARSPS